MIKVYATKEEYSRYGSNKLIDLSEEEINQYLELASIDINNATLTRIEKKGFNNLTENQQYLIAKATCLQAEFIKEQGAYEDYSEVSSFSISGDLTVNEKEPRDLYRKLKISRIAFSYLKRTGLTSRII